MPDNNNYELLKDFLKSKCIPQEDREDIQGIVSGKPEAYLQSIRVKTSSGNMYWFLIEENNGSPFRLIPLDKRYEW